MTRYANGTASDAERAMVERWYESEAARRKLGNEHHFEHLNAEIWAGTLQKAGIERPAARRRMLPFYRVAAAAAVLVLIAAGLRWFQSGRQTANIEQPVVAQQQILPGSNKAVLTLGNGTAISLTDAAKGELARQGSTRISKTKEGQLAYEPGTGGEAASRNTISTPRGGQYRIDLPDGSRVWLNAASSLTFPASFAGLQERSVELSGEAYFEVAEDANKPFRVISGGHRVEVLGTHFNVNAYNDEPVVRTSLLEGAVRVGGKGQSRVLSPGQQARVQENGQLSVAEGIDMSAVVAWKNGRFNFSGAPITEVMREVQRWYGAEIVYEGEVKHHFVGSLPRNLPVSRVLEMLEMTGRVKFSIEGNRITVRP